MWYAIDDMTDYGNYLLNDFHILAIQVSGDPERARVIKNKFGIDSNDYFLLDWKKGEEKFPKIKYSQVFGSLLERILKILPCA